ncbi:unnamed protein product [Mycena citricolor]|uniref:GH16 domain-containing protein n=1 Tax=Mycena citricolor TaxID=2018698 RepID=A0AAD2H553_9AGAR|nr:unnamed protein product [Mycena citricolor]
MPSFSLLATLSLPLLALAAPHDIRSVNAHRRDLGKRSTFKLVDHFNGTDFLKWDFFSAADPTHGAVNYLTAQEAQAKNLAFTQKDGTTVLAVDNTTKLKPGQKRDSVRISSPKSYNQGLFIMDAWAMPHGPTVWPAFWMVGPNWPLGGEIDIVEGVEDASTNQMTLHTSEGCSLATSLVHEFTGAHTSTTDCTSGGSNNNGCGITDANPKTYGHEFNLAAGGAWATLVDNSGIKIWHFERNAMPSDITAQKPNPSNWGKPAAFFSSSACQIASHFSNMVMTFDTTLCGDWDGAVFQGGSTACANAVADPSNYDLAKWMLNYVSVYESS